MHAPFDPDRPWVLHPQVALRPERFGALAYHYGTRRLSFLKDPTLVAIVETLGQHPSARVACTAARVGDDRRPAYERALATLASTGMLAERAS